MFTKPVLVLVLYITFFSQAFETTASKFLMGTKVDITVVGESVQECKKAMYFAFMEMERVEKLLSSHMPKSDISKLNNLAFRKATSVSKECYDIVSRGIMYSKKYAGSFDISIGNVSFLWGFSGDKNVEVPTTTDLKKALSTVDINSIILTKSTHSIQFTKNIRLDLGGIAKGYSIDRAALILKENNIHNFIINAGGDVFASGEKLENQKWKLGIKHPRNPQELSAQLELKNLSIATSGDYERFIIKDKKRFHHILNPLSGMPAEHFQSVSVIAESAEEADVIATHIFVNGLSKNTESYSYFIVDHKNKSYSSKSFKSHKLKVYN